MANGRCRMHGGRSTGPRTSEGLARSRRARWQHGFCSTEHRARVRRAIRSELADDAPDELVRRASYEEQATPVIELDNVSLAFDYPVLEDVSFTVEQGETLVIVGESDFCTPPHLSEQMAAAIPGAELAKLPGGHFFYMEHPQAFHDRVEAFIAKNGG